MGETIGRVDELALVQQTLQSGATPTMIAGFAMIIAQMQSQATHPDVLLTITSSIGSLKRSASFLDGTWHGYGLTHDLIHRRYHQRTYHKLTASKRARDQGEQPNTCTSKEPLASSPTQSEARRQSIMREWLTSAETQQLDITANETVRLQREVPVTAEEAGPLRQKTTSKRAPQRSERLRKKP